MSIKRVMAIAIAAVVLGFLLGSFGIAGAVGAKQGATPVATQCGGACGDCTTQQAADCAGAGDCASCPTPGQCDTCPSQGDCPQAASGGAAAPAGGACGSGACGTACQ